MRLERDQVARSARDGAPHMLFRLSIIRLSWFFCPLTYFDLKKSLYIWSWRVLGRRAPHKHRNTKTETSSEKIGERNSVGITAGGISTLCTVFFLEASLMEKLDFWCYFDGVNVAISSVAWLLFLQFFFRFWLCASVMPLGQCIVTETECNWYLRDINICFFCQKGV
jgi:hypothetical protein